MKKIYFVLGGILLVSILGLVYFDEEKDDVIWIPQVDAAFTTIDCPTPPQRVFDDSSYKGPLIDTHIHVPHIPENWDEFNDKDTERPSMGVNMRITDYICMMNYENTSKVFAFFPVWEPIIEPSVAVVKKTMSLYPDRFVPFIMPPDHDDRRDGFPTVNAQALSQMLNVSPELFKGYGEIGLYARGDHGGPKGAPALFPDAQRLQEIYPLVRAHRLLVYFHLGEGQKESFEKILDENPDISFIWHGDQLIPSNDGMDDLSNIDDILSKHPNAYYGVDELYGGVWLIRPEVSKEEFLAHFKNYEPLLKKDLETWKDFIERHPDQVLWGTDRGWSSPWSIDTEVAITLNNYSRAFIGRLDSSVQEKFAYKNAEKLIE